MDAKILVSDDEELWREDVIGDALRNQDYEVHTVESIEKTIEILRREFFHVVTIDLSFSEDHTILEGRETMRLLKTFNEGTKAIVLTGYGTVNSAVEALKNFEVFDFLEKGKNFDEENFLNIVKKAVQEVKISSVHLRLTTSLENVISGFSLSNIASTIGEKEDEIRWLILNLMNDVVPAILSDKNGEFIETDAGIIFKRHLWSRLLGKPLVLAFGLADAMEMFCETFNGVVKSNSTKKAVGCLFEAVDLSFEDFSPVLKNSI